MCQKLTRDIGKIQVTTEGGLWHKSRGRAVTLDLVAINTPQFGTTLFGYFDVGEWDVHTDGLLYTDKAVERAVNNYLACLGFCRGAIWSEQGAQTYEYADFDVLEELARQLFPDVSRTG